MTTTIDPSIFKAYDVRGLTPGQLDGEIARRIGCAFIEYLGAKRIAVGRDMRTSSPDIAAGVDNHRIQVAPYGGAAGCGLIECSRCVAGTSKTPSPPWRPRPESARFQFFA